MGVDFIWPPRRPPSPRPRRDPGLSARAHPLIQIRAWLKPTGLQDLLPFQRLAGQTISLAQIVVCLVARIVSLLLSTNAVGCVIVRIHVGFWACASYYECTISHSAPRCSFLVAGAFFIACELGVPFGLRMHLTCPSPV